MSSGSCRGRLVQVYRSPERDQTYLIVDRRDGLERVPQALLARFGRPQPSIVFQLTPERRLARGDAARVLAAIEMQGFHLQLPPTDDEREIAP